MGWDSSKLTNGGKMAENKTERKRRRRPPRKVLRRPTPEEMMSDAEFRRWCYHAPASLKRMAYEVIKRLARTRPQAGNWTDRV
jgi:hypothetical protein